MDSKADNVTVDIEVQNGATHMIRLDASDALPICWVPNLVVTWNEGNYLDSSGVT